MISYSPTRWRINCKIEACESRSGFGDGISSNEHLSAHRDGEHILPQIRFHPSSTFGCARDYQTLSRIYHAVSEDRYSDDTVLGLAELIPRYP